MKLDSHLLQPEGKGEAEPLPSMHKAGFTSQCQEERGWGMQEHAPRTSAPSLNYHKVVEILS